MKEIELGLERIVSLAERMVDKKQPDTDRAIAFAAIKMIVDKLRGINIEKNHRNGYASEKLASILWHSEALAHLNDGNGHPDDQHIVWLITAVGSAGSAQALGGVAEN